MNEEKLRSLIQQVLREEQAAAPGKQKIDAEGNIDSALNALATQLNVKADKLKAAVKNARGRGRSTADNAILADVFVALLNADDAVVNKSLAIIRKVEQPEGEK